MADDTDRYLAFMGLAPEAHPALGALVVPRRRDLPDRHRLLRAPAAVPAEAAGAVPAARPRHPGDRRPEAAARARPDGQELADRRARPPPRPLGRRRDRALGLGRARSRPPRMSSPSPRWRRATSPTSPWSSRSDYSRRGEALPAVPRRLPGRVGRPGARRARPPRSASTTPCSCGRC